MSRSAELSRPFPADLLAALIEHDTIGVVAGRGGDVVYGNARFLDILGVSAEPDWEVLNLAEYLDRDAAALIELARLGRFSYEKEFQRVDGVRVPVLLNGVDVVHDSYDWVATVTDLTELREVQYRASLAERTLRQQDSVDPLTGLGTEAVLLSRIERATIRARWDPPGYGLLVCEVAQYSRLVGTVSRSRADELLTSVASRLVATGAGLVTRLEGARFGILCPRSAGLVEILDVARRMQAMMAMDLEPVTLSIGVAMGPVGSAEELLCQAHAALRQALDRAPGIITVYEPGLHAQAMERLIVAHELPGSITRDEMEVYYQPIVDLDTQRVIGAEALLRWHHPRRGLLSPAEFISVAEEYGCILDIGQWVLAQACEWAQVHGVGRIHVNISPRQLVATDLVQQVRDALRTSGLAPGALTLEVTENALMHDLDAADRQLLDLKLLGVRISIDDFGIGYCSLGYLKRFPVDELKIDRLFIQGIAEDSMDHAIVAAIVALAAATETDIVAEGVVSARQIGILHAMGIRVAQGYYWSPAVPAADFAALDRGPVHSDS